MKYSRSFLFAGFVLVLLTINTGCRLAGRHSDAKVISTEQPTILKDSAKLKDTAAQMTDTAGANQAD